MRHSILSALAVLLLFPRCGYGEPREFRPPDNPEPLNNALVQYVTLQIDDGNEGTMVAGKTYKISGEVEMPEGDAPFTFMLVRLLAHHDRAPGGVILQEALADITLIEGSRYAFTSDLSVPDYKVGGEVELRIQATPQDKGVSDPIYRETVTLLPASGSETD
jgi:hypothetical protein